MAVAMPMMTAPKTPRSTSRSTLPEDRSRPNSLRSHAQNLLSIPGGTGNLLCWAAPDRGGRGGLCGGRWRGRGRSVRSGRGARAGARARALHGPRLNSILHAGEGLEQPEVLLLGEAVGHAGQVVAD